MAFSDPQSITVNSVAQSMPRIETSARKSIYQKNDQTFTLEISHLTTNAGRVRSLAKFSERAVVTNPLDSTNDYDTLSIQMVIDRPSFGFSMTRLEQDVAGFVAWLTTGNVDKLYGQES
jgi:hypothetical protein